MSDDEDPVGSNAGFDNRSGTFGQDDENMLAADDEVRPDDDLDVMAENAQEDFNNNFEVNGSSEPGGFTAKEDRITTRYLTKYERARCWELEPFR